MRPKTIARVVLALLMVAVGTLHFVAPAPFVRIVPRALPRPGALVYLSGFFEILGGLGLLVPRTRRVAAWGLVALYVAVFPANVNMAVNNLPFGAVRNPTLAWLRLPFQAVFILWAWWCARPDPPPLPPGSDRPGSGAGCLQGEPRE
jgi:uncharacterized membrane protein